MEINDFINLIGNIGFPAVISLYVLVRLEKQLINLTASINKLNIIISTKLGFIVPNDEIAN